MGFLFWAWLLLWGTNVSVLSSVCAAATLGRLEMLLSTHFGKGPESCGTHALSCLQKKRTTASRLFWKVLVGNRCHLMCNFQVCFLSAIQCYLLTTWTGRHKVISLMCFNFLIILLSLKSSKRHNQSYDVALRTSSLGNSFYSMDIFWLGRSLFPCHCEYLNKSHMKRSRFTLNY